MKFLGKILAVVIVLIVLVLIGAVVFVKFYLTDERVRGLVIPQAEQALGRNVAIGAIDVSIFSGINIQDFAIKEENRQENFVQAESFVMSYEIMPLLRKEFIVSEIRLNKPAIHIIRDKDGSFNFDSLAFLQDKKPAQKEQPPAVSLPVALTIKRMVVDQAAITLVDRKQEIPDTRMLADLNVEVDMGTTLESLQLNGELDLTADATYGDLQPHARVKADFTQQKVNYTADLNIAEEKLNISGNIDQIQTKAPDILCNLTSQQLDIDHLLALAASLPQAATTEPGPPRDGKPGQKDEPIAAAIPAGLTAHGLIAIDKALYNKLTINNFEMRYNLQDGILAMEELAADTAGGSINSTANADLTVVDPSYQGKISLNSIDLQQLAADLGKDFADIISGSFKSEINFTGKGFSPEVIKKHLGADATYSITNGRIQSTPFTQSIATLTGLQEFETINFENVNGELHVVEGGKVNIDTTVAGPDFNAYINGTATLDGNLQLPVTMNLAPALGGKLDTQGVITQFFTNEQGETVLKLMITGTFSNPKVSLDTAGAQEQVQEKVKERALQELDQLIRKQQEPKNDSGPTERGTAPQSPAEKGLELFKGLFNR